MAFKRPKTTISVDFLRIPSVLICSFKVWKISPSIGLNYNIRWCLSRPCFPLDFNNRNYYTANSSDWWFQGMENVAATVNHVIEHETAIYVVDSIFAFFQRSNPIYCQHPLLVVLEVTKCYNRVNYESRHNLQYPLISAVISRSEFDVPPTPPVGGFRGWRRRLSRPP